MPTYISGFEKKYIKEIFDELTEQDLSNLIYDIDQLTAHGNFPTKTFFNVDRLKKFSNNIKHSIDKKIKSAWKKNDI